jgi:hypothetical protein
MPMLSAEQVKGLKQSNVSKDTEKTKARIKADFKAATNAMKQAIVEQSGLKRGTIYKVYERGTAGAQIVLALAEVLKVSPYYYTGELDDRAPLKDADILNFLDSRGYTALSEELKAGASEEVTTKQKRKYTRKPKPEPTEKPAPEEPNEKAPPSAAEIAESNEQLAPEAETVLDTMDVKITLPENPGIHETVETLTEEETVMLLKALFIKEKAGGAPAEMLKIIKRCLLV